MEGSALNETTNSVGCALSQRLRFAYRLRASSHVLYSYLPSERTICTAAIESSVKHSCPSLRLELTAGPG